MHPLLSIQNLDIAFRSETGTNTAVQHLSLEVNRGELVAVVGESGSGKSVTSLSILQLLPKANTIYANGKILFATDGTKVDDLLLTSEYVESHLKIGVDSLKQLMNQGLTVRHLQF